MYTSVQQELKKTLDEIQSAGLYKRERLLDSPQASHVSSSSKRFFPVMRGKAIGDDVTNVEASLNQ